MAAKLPAPLGTEPPAPRHSPPLLERASAAAFWNAAFVPLKLLAKLVASIVVVRVLRSDGFAVVTQLTALLGTLGMVSDLGLERALPRFIPEFEMTEGRAGLNRLLRRVTLLKLLTMVPFVLALLLFPDFFITQLKLTTEQARLLPGAGRGLDAGPLLLGIV
ncbi:MAG TPA: hypothetical protein VM536_11955, partial [Chloroflexia bacterium]|nr:hypothetical protein [Chloroflexia bacterium]